MYVCVCVAIQLITFKSKSQHGFVKLLKHKRLFLSYCLLMKLTAVFLILSFPAVVLAVTAEYSRNTATGIGALKLTGQTHVNICKSHIQTH